MMKEQAAAVEDALMGHLHWLDQPKATRLAQLWYGVVAEAEHDTMRVALGTDDDEAYGTDYEDLVMAHGMWTANVQVTILYALHDTARHV